MLGTWLASHVELGNLEKAREIAQRLIEYDPDFSLARAGKGTFNLATDSHYRIIVDALRKVGVPE